MLKKIFLGVLAFIVLMTASLYVMVMHTAVPFHVVQMLMHAAGIGSEGISGSISSGLHIDRVHIGSAENYFTLEDFQFSYNGIADFYRTRELNVSELRIGKLHVKIRPAGTSKSPLKIDKNTRDGDRAGRHTIDDNAPRPSRRPLNIRITKILVMNIVFDLPELTTPIVIENCQFNNVSLLDGKLEFANISVRSNALDLDVLSESSDRANATSVTKTIAGKLKPSYLKQLKQEISFAGKFKLVDGSMDRPSLHATAFDSKLIVRFNEADLLTVKLDALNLGDYFNNPPPVKITTLEVALGPKISDFSTFRINSGEFNIGPSKFTMPTGLLFKDRLIVEGFHIQPGIHINARLADAGLALKSKPNLDGPEILARLLYQKPLARLNAAQKQEAVRNAAQFTYY